MIEFKLGKTGSGKSYLCVKEIIEFLTSTDAYIVTNVPLLLGELNAYMQRKYPDRSIDVIGRVRLLEKAETREFYLHREYGNDLQPVTKQSEKLLQFPDFESAALKSGKPVVYVLDEAHIYWDARAWAEVGLTLNFYCSQHEKFSAHIIFCTQFLKQVEMRLREHATQFEECVNHGLRSLWIWRQPKYFTVRRTYGPPPCPAENTQRYTLDKEIAATYRTTGGVGVTGNVATRFEKKRKGLPAWTVFILAGGVCAAIYWGPDKLIGLLMHRVDPAPTEHRAEPVKTVDRSAANGFGMLPSAAPGLPPVVIPSQPLRICTGVLRWGNRFLIQFEDGTTMSNDDNQLAKLKGQPVPVEFVSRRLVVVEGVKYPVRPRPVVAQSKRPEVGQAYPAPHGPDRTRPDGEGQNEYSEGVGSTSSTAVTTNEREKPDRAAKRP